MRQGARRAVAGGAAAAALAGSYGAGYQHGRPDPKSSGGQEAICHARHGGAAPDPACNPGEINPDVTQATIRTTICVAGWTATIRPSSSVIAKVEDNLIRIYGLDPETAEDLTVDHWIPLSLGGHPFAQRNLFPQPAGVARRKDTVERRLHRDVCEGRSTLTSAQEQIRAWKP